MSKIKKAVSLGFTWTALGITGGGACTLDHCSTMVCPPWAIDGVGHTKISVISPVNPTAQIRPISRKFLPIISNPSFVDNIGLTFPRRKRAQVFILHKPNLPSIVLTFFVSCLFWLSLKAIPWLACETLDLPILKCLPISFKAFPLYCQLRIKSEPFLLDLQFKSEHLKTGLSESLKTTGYQRLLGFVKHAESEIQFNGFIDFRDGACKQEQLSESLYPIHSWCC